MNQNDIRDFNNETYTVPEGAAIVKELNDRTKHDEDGYNSMAEIGSKVKQLYEYESRTVEQPYYANEAAMIADQGSQTEGLIYRYNAPEISHFVYLGTTTGTIADYDPISQEEIDAFLNSANFQIKELKSKVIDENVDIPAGEINDFADTSFVIEVDNDIVNAIYYDQGYSALLAKYRELKHNGERIFLNMYNSSQNKSVVAEVDSYEMVLNNTICKANLVATGNFAINEADMNVTDVFHLFLPYVGGYESGGPNTISVASEITENTTISGAQKGLNSLYPINSSSDVKITVNKGTYVIGDVINFKRRGSGEVAFHRGENVRLEGYRSLDNIHRLQHKGNLASVVFDRLDGDVLVGTVIGDISKGYTGPVTTSFYGNLREDEVGKSVTVIGMGFSENILISVSENAILNSWTFVSDTEITLNLDAVGDEGDTFDILYDNGDLSTDTVTIIGSLDVPTANIKRYFKFNSNTTDAAGVENGTATNVTYGTGKVNNCIELTGNQSYVILPNHTDLNFGNGTTDSPFSFDFWVKRKIGTGRFLLSKRLSGPSGHQYQIRTDNSGKLIVELFDDSTGGQISVTTVPTLNQDEWLHIAITYDGQSLASGILVYINGVSVSVTTSSQGSYVAMEAFSGDLALGTQSWNLTTSSSWDGDFDEFRVWNIALTLGQIQSILDLNNNGTELL
ncbi:LamG domain-containing protein [Winogradskyella psychrotolerans]|uniref:LamG domain-containing protein n=1 Tax=Winogradskyella psychrotolerans TaxID=1344585 RepID=UPI001C068CFC|nr:LamG domain-containing protein [Winogradskyella psychrotolerans]MBU2923063.1 LamG domain-containing protein [Winogradskyella psychrotolerans]